MAESNDIPLLPSHVVAERSHVVIPSLPNWIEPTVEFLRRKAVLGGVCEETRSGKLLIALHEAISNAIIHGNLELSSAATALSLKRWRNARPILRWQAVRLTSSSSLMAMSIAGSSPIKAADSTSTKSSNAA